mgnify:FL=1
MKKILFLAICLSSVFSVSSQTKYAGDTITYQNANELSYAKNFKNFNDFKVALLADGNYISIGDTIMIGKPGTNDTRFSAVAGQGISTKSTFTTLSFGSPVGGALMASLTNDDGKLLASWSETEMIVHRIFVNHTKYSRNSTLNIGVIMKELDGNRKATTTSVHGSLKMGEVYLLNRMMTRQEAISKLKESKDLLDLEMISQEEYDALKIELTPIIRGAK